MINKKYQNINNINILKNIASSFTDHLQLDDVVYLSGDLGAGKTTFIRYCIEEMIKDDKIIVTSPTFSIMNTYSNNMFSILHVDLYRVKNLAEVYALNLHEISKKHLLFIEWPEYGMSLVPKATFLVEIQCNENLSRSITINSISSHRPNTYD
jgi:tRNA threonylcarbamoyladenosine biosynthesis protein TsaE